MVPIKVDGVIACVWSAVWLNSAGVTALMMLLVMVMW